MGFQRNILIYILRKEIREGSELYLILIIIARNNISNSVKPPTPIGMINFEKSIL